MGLKRFGIAGAGVAGLALAVGLARQGHEVVVHDRLDAPAPLGSGLILQPVGLHVLSALGLADAVRSLGAPITRLFGRAAPHNRVVLDVRYDALRSRQSGLGVHRGALFGVLLQAAAEAKVALEPQAEIVSAESGRFLYAHGGRSARFDVLVDALGVRSPLVGRPRQELAFGALWANVAWEDALGFDGAALEQRYRAARQMVGVMPIGRVARDAPAQGAFFWSLKRRDFGAWRAAPIERWKDDVRALWPQTAPLLDAIKSHDDLVFATYAHHTLANPASPPLVHIGDAVHAASPQLGQGANMALLDVYALLTALRRQPHLETALHEYARMRALHVRLYQSASFLFTPFYQSDSAFLAAVRDYGAAQAAQIWPGPQLLAALVSGVLGSPIETIERRRGKDAR
jgi:2-polyprenyl-6-methoxyphenol hydroxylase-like FAD-dependent oxidoreductase